MPNSSAHRRMVTKREPVMLIVNTILPWLSLSCNINTTLHIAIEPLTLLDVVLKSYENLASFLRVFLTTGL